MAALMNAPQIRAIGTTKARWQAWAALHANQLEQQLSLIMLDNDLGQSLQLRCWLA